MQTTILDYSLRGYLQSMLNKLPLNLQEQMRSVRLCGSRVVPQKVGAPAVFLVSNGKSSSFVGSGHCGNTFACPICSAKKMAKYAREIAAAIEILAKKNYVAVMLTLTVPHLQFMKCRDVADILHGTFQRFRSRLREYKTGRSRSLSKEAEFTVDVELAHHVAVYEYTYGNNGWHPHIHMLLWVPRKNLCKVGKWEEHLRKCWLAQAKRETIKNFQKNPKIIDAKDRANWLFEITKSQNGLYFSKTAEGKIRESAASEYICGWGSDKELTGNFRKNATHEGHYTPYQLLEKAYHGDKFAEKLYLEYAIAVTQKPTRFRIRWSQTGIKALIKVKVQQEHYEEIYKKKELDEPAWKVLLWFTRDDWSCVRLFERHSPMLANILYLARDHPELLREFLDGLGIPYREPDENYFTSHIENIYNGIAA